MKDLKERTLYWVLRIALVVIKVTTKFVAKEYHLPITWLHHFIQGSGKSMNVPDKVINDSCDVFLQAIQADCYYSIRHNYELFGKYCVCHSTLYKGSGFHGRPTLFYLVGGFTFKLYPHGDNMIVAGHDTYDWHSDGSGNYFTSPLGSNPVIVALVRLAGKIWGTDLFCVGTEDGMICAAGEENQARISNKLWEVMYQYGAKDFQSWFKTEIPMDNESWEVLWSVFKSIYDDYWYVPEDDDYDYEPDSDDEDDWDELEEELEDD